MGVLEPPKVIEIGVLCPYYAFKWRRVLHLYLLLSAPIQWCPFSFSSMLCY